MPLSRLIYYSTIKSCDSKPERDRMIYEIVEASRKNNQLTESTSALFEGGNHFLQIIEGQRSILTEILAKILNDNRHYDVRIIEFKQITERMFGDWPMYHHLDNGLIMKIIDEQVASETSQDPVLGPDEISKFMRFAIQHNNCTELHAITS